MVTGLFVDTLKTRSGPLSLGPKNTMMVLITAQLLALLLLPFASVSVFVACCCVVYFTFSGAAVAGSIAARSLFGEANAGIVFGSTGIAVGFGDLTSSWLVQMHSTSKTATTLWYTHTHTHTFIHHRHHDV